MIKKNDRPKFVAEAIYTNTLEGKRVSDFFLEEASRYCNDEIDLAEFDRRLCKHYGISPSQLEKADFVSIGLLKLYDEKFRVSYSLEDLQYIHASLSKPS